MALDQEKIDSIANVVIQKRVKASVENRVAARGGTKADEAKVLKRIAEKLS